MSLVFGGTMDEFENIINKNKVLLYSIVYGITGNYDADDIVQDTFVYAYYHYGTLKDKSKLASWLCAIARNKAYDSIRRSCRLVSMDVLGEAINSVTPENLVLISEEKDILMSEIRAMSEKYRETVLMYYFAGKSIKEISELLSVPEGTIKFRLSEARKKLKKELIEFMNKEKPNIEKKDIFARIKEETEKANKAIKSSNTRLASEICDAMLDKIDDLSTLSKEQLSILYNLYSTKIHAIRFAEGLNACDKYLKKLIEIVEAAGDNSWISNTYLYYAAQLSNMGKGDEATKYYALALEKAEESGNISDIADCLCWCGLNAMQNKVEGFGMSYFKRVLAMKESLLSATEKEITNKTSYVLSYSAAVVLERAGERITEIDSFNSTMPGIVYKDDGFYLSGQPGVCSSGDLLEDIFYIITRMSPCLSLKIKEGYVFEQSTFSYSHTAIRSRFEVISMNEKVKAPAGVFDNCLHTRYTNFVNEDDNELNKKTNGITDIWYAPHVGVVCITFTPFKGNKRSVKLKSYSVESEADVDLPHLYLPLAIGNEWSYESYDFNDVPLSEVKDYENLFEVVCKRNYDNAVLIAHSAWSCPKKN